MINPARRLLYEMFVLPILSILQAGIDLYTRTARKLHPWPFVRPQILRWEGDRDFSKRVRHLGLLFAAAGLLCAISANAQQTPPYFPSGSGSGSPSDKDARHDDGKTDPKRMPPDTTAPAHTKLTSAEAEQQIQNKLDDEPMLNGLSLLASVDDESVTLNGTVATEQQRDAAVHIVRSYSGKRKIIDQLTVANVR